MWVKNSCNLKILYTRLETLSAVFPLSNLTIRLLYYNSGKILNPDWDVNQAWKEFKDSIGFIDELCEAANRDIANYLAETGR